MKINEYDRGVSQSLGLGAYTQQIPGITLMTPMSQFGSRQSPTLGGLGAVDTTGASVTGILDKVKQLVIDNPVPVLFLIAALAFK